MTFHHHIEEIMSAPYRYIKNFTGDYIDFCGRKSQKTYSIYVRDLVTKVEAELDPVGVNLWEEKISKGLTPNLEMGLRVARAN